MSRSFLAGTAFLGIVAFGSTARAVLIDFTYTGNLVDFTVPATGTYRILAFGAQRGSGVDFQSIGTGGRGAEIGGDFVLTAGEMLQIAVGGEGVGRSPAVAAVGGGGRGGSLW